LVTFSLGKQRKVARLEAKKNGKTERKTIQTNTNFAMLLKRPYLSRQLAKSSGTKVIKPLLLIPLPSIRT
jgi:hypothetical protein